MNTSRSFEKNGYSASNKKLGGKFDNRAAFLGKPSSKRRESKDILAGLEQGSKVKEAKITALLTLNQTSKNLEKAWADANAAERAQALQLALTQVENKTTSYDFLSPAERAQALQLALTQVENKTTSYDFLSPKVKYLLLLLLLLITSNSVLTACSSEPPTNGPVVTIPTEMPTEIPAEPTPVDEINVSEVSGNLTPEPTDAAPTEAPPVDTSYPGDPSGWIKDEDTTDDRAAVEAADPEGLKAMEMIIEDQARIQGKTIVKIEVHTAGSGYSVTGKDESGAVVYAVQISNNLPYSSLSPFGTTLGPDGKRVWKLESTPLLDPSNTQVVVESANGAFYTVFEYDKDGNLVRTLDLRNSTWTKVENYRTSIERAQQIAPETVTINGDYGYNAKGGVCNIFDEEKKDWIGVPFSDDYIVPIQYVPGIAEISMNWYINKVNRYGLPGEGALEVKDANGKVLYSVALSVDALSKVTDPSSPMFDEWQVAEVPIIIFNPDGTIFSNGFLSYKNPPERPNSLEEIEKELAFINYVSAVAEENKKLYDTPDQNNHYSGLDPSTSNIPKLDRGDVIATNFFKEDVTPKSDASKRIKDWLGFDPSIANISGFEEFMEDGEVLHLPKNDEGIALLYPSRAQAIADKQNK